MRRRLYQKQGSTSKNEWEKKYQRRSLHDFRWYLPEPPSELVEFLERTDVMMGPALDVGCGPGVVTSYLATRFRPAIGIDLSTTALCCGRDLAVKQGSAPDFLIADAVSLPCRDNSFSLIFDRGCLHNLPRPRWGRYFREIERVLRPEGYYQLLCNNTKNLPPVWSIRGTLARIKWYIVGNKGWMSYRLLKRLRPSSWKTVVLEDFPFRFRNGEIVYLTHGVFQKNTVV